MSVFTEADADAVNVRTLILPFAVCLLAMMAAVQAVIVLDDNRVSLLSTLLLGAVAMFYAVFFVTRGPRLRQVRFGMLVAHATAYAIVNVSYLLHAAVLIVVNDPAIRGDGYFLMDPAWFGVTFGMATGWGIGLVIHALASVAMRGWEEHP
jgi:hypothetical protein